MKKWFSLGIVLFFGIILFNWIFKSEDKTPVVIEIPIEDNMTIEEVEKLIRELVPSIHEELHEKMLVELRKQKKKWEKLAIEEKKEIKKQEQKEKE